MPSDLTAAEFEVISRWEVGEVLSARVSGQGAVNHTVLLEAEHGAYALRAYRPDKRREEVELEHRMIFHAWMKGICAVPPLALPEGGTYLEHQGRFYALFAKAPGFQVARDALTAEHMTLMGQFLARLNLALADFPTEGLYRRSFDTTVSDTLTRIARLEAKIGKWPKPGFLEDSAMMCLDQQRDYLRRNSRAFDLGGITFQATHGDFHEGNLFFEGEQIVALIDWDQVRAGARAWDAIRYASFLTIDRPPGLIRVFLRAFVEDAGLAPGEFERTVRLFAAYHAHDLWALEAYYLEGNPQAKFFISPIFVPFEERWAGIGFRGG
ncbi:MAG: phosphotransferase [Meiothermus sp.]|nr:phosphotransferase [Meiothermus sp.]